MPFSHCILIAFVSAAINHLGLVAAAEGVIRRRLPIINCPKCLAFWLTLACSLVFIDYSGGIAAILRGGIEAAAMALLMAYLAIWTELLMGGIDILFSKAYESLYPTEDSPADDKTGAGGTLHDVRTQAGR